MTTIYNLDYRVRLLESKIHKFYCYLKNLGFNIESENVLQIAKDIEITDFSKGIILTSPSGNKFRVTVSDTGELITVSV